VSGRGGDLWFGGGARGLESTPRASPGCTCCICSSCVSCPPIP
jgi:hypothetical protein